MYSMSLAEYTIIQNCTSHVFSSCKSNLLTLNRLVFCYIWFGICIYPTCEVIMCCGQFYVKNFWKYVLVNKQQMCIWSFVAFTHV